MSSSDHYDVPLERMSDHDLSRLEALQEVQEAKNDGPQEDISVITWDESTSISATKVTVSTTSKVATLQESDATSFSAMQVSGVLLLVLTMLGYIYVLWLARRHRLQIENGSALSVHLLNAKKKEEAKAAAEKEAASADRLYYRKMDKSGAAKKERASFFRSGSRWNIFSTIFEEESNMLSTSTSAKNLAAVDDMVVEKQADAEQPSNNTSKAHVVAGSEPWTCQVDLFSAELPLPLSINGDIVNSDEDKEAPTNSEDKPIPWKGKPPLLLPTWKNPSLTKLATLSEPEGSHNPLVEGLNQDIVFDPFVPKEHTSPNHVAKAVSTPSTMSKPSSEDDDSSAAFQPSLAPSAIMGSTCTTAPSSEAITNVEPCRNVDPVLETPTTKLPSSPMPDLVSSLTLSDAPTPKLLVPTDVESQVVIFRNKDDASAIYAQPTNGTTDPLGPQGPPPDHFV